MMDSRDPPEIDPLSYLCDLANDLTPYQMKEEYARLRPVLAALFQTDRAQFGVVANLVKKKLGIGKRDLQANLKALQQDADETALTVPSARFTALVDLVKEEAEVRFLVMDEHGGLRTETEWEVDDQRLVPPPRDNVPWPLLQAEEIIDVYDQQHDPASLYADLCTYYRSLIDLPAAAHYDLLAAFTFHTYIIDFPDVTHSPELVFYAVPERGKSRAGKAITHVAYRGLRTETLREANVFRWSEDLAATLFFDVMDLWKKAVRERSEDLFLNRFEKGAQAARVLNPEKGPFADTRYFDIFGATVIATNESIQKILGTRCLTITMPPARRRFQNEPTAEGGKNIRTRLLAWRARQMGNPLPVVAKTFDGRFGDITRPLLQVVRCIAPDAETGLVALFRQMEQERRKDKSRTIEGDLLAAMGTLHADVLNGKLLLKRLVEAINAEREEADGVKGRLIAPHLRALGFQLTSRNPREIIWNTNLLQECQVSYGLIDSQNHPETPSQHSQHSQNSSTRVHTENIENVEKQNTEWGEI